jgi:hypothetical protein
MKVGVLFVLVGVASTSVVSHAQTPAGDPPATPAREGRIIVFDAVGDPSRSSVAAIFSDGPAWGTPERTEGPCTLFRPGPTTGRSAGAITITGTVVPIALQEAHADQGVRYERTGAASGRAFAGGATLAVAAAGGADVPAFSASLSAPGELVGYVPPKALSRAGYTATWAAGSGGEIMIMISAADPQTRDGRFVRCQVPDTGSFTVPASTLAMIPESHAQAKVVVARVAERTLMAGDTRVTIDVGSVVTSDVLMLESAPAHDSPAHDPASYVGAPRALAAGSPRAFVGFAFVYGGASRVGAIPPTHDSGLRVDLGVRLADMLHLVGEVGTLAAGYTSPYATNTTETHSAYGAGLRWAPFASSSTRGISLLDPHAYYGMAVVGLGSRYRVIHTTPTETMEDTELSPMASLSVGLVAIQSFDWSIEFELREQLAHFDGELQRAWLTSIALHLDRW